MEKMVKKNELAFLDMAVYVDEQKMSLLNDTKSDQTLEQLKTSVAALPYCIRKKIVEGNNFRLFRSSIRWL